MSKNIASVPQATEEMIAALLGRTNLLPQADRLAARPVTRSQQGPRFAGAAARG